MGWLRAIFFIHQVISTFQCQMFILSRLCCHTVYVYVSYVHNNTYQHIPRNNVLLLRRTYYHEGVNARDIISFMCLQRWYNNRKKTNSKVEWKIDIRVIVCMLWSLSSTWRILSNLFCFKYNPFDTMFNSGIRNIVVARNSLNIKTAHM